MAEDEGTTELGDVPFEELARLLFRAMIVHDASAVVEPDPDDPDRLIVRAITVEGEELLEASLTPAQVHELMAGGPAPRNN